MKYAALQEVGIRYKSAGIPLTLTDGSEGSGKGRVDISFTFKPAIIM